MGRSKRALEGIPISATRCAAPFGLATAHSSFPCHTMQKGRSQPPVLPSGVDKRNLNNDEVRAAAWAGARRVARILASPNPIPEEMPEKLEKALLVLADFSDQIKPLAGISPPKPGENQQGQAADIPVPYASFLTLSFLSSLPFLLLTPVARGSRIPSSSRTSAKPRRESLVGSRRTSSARASHPPPKPRLPPSRSFFLFPFFSSHPSFFRIWSPNQSRPGRRSPLPSPTSRSWLRSLSSSRRTSQSSTTPRSWFSTTPSRSPRSSTPWRLATAPPTTPSRASPTTSAKISRRRASPSAPSRTTASWPWSPSFFSLLSYSYLRLDG